MIVLLFIENNSNFIVNKRISGNNTMSLGITKHCSFKISSPKIFHTNIETCLITSWKQSTNSSINCHCLIAFILYSKSMCKSNPTVNVISIYQISFLKIFPSKFIFLYKIIITSNTKPGQWMLRIILN
jgi:hypothetical protein